MHTLQIVMKAVLSSNANKEKKCPKKASTSTKVEVMTAMMD